MGENILAIYILQTQHIQMPHIKWAVHSRAGMEFSEAQS